MQFSPPKPAQRRRSASTTFFSLQVVGARVSKADSAVSIGSKLFTQPPALYTLSEPQFQAQQPVSLNLDKLYEVELINGNGRRSGQCVLCNLVRSCGGGYYDIVLLDGGCALGQSGRCVTFVHETFLREHVPPSNNVAEELQTPAHSWTLFANADEGAGLLSAGDFSADDHFVISRRHRTSHLPEEGNWRFDGYFFCNDAGDSQPYHPGLGDLLLKEASEHNSRARFLHSGPGIWFVRWAGSKTTVKGVPPSGFVGTDFPAAELQLMMNATVNTSAGVSSVRSSSIRGAAARGCNSQDFSATAPAGGSPLDACASNGSDGGRAKGPQRSRSAARLPKLASRKASPPGRAELPMAAQAEAANKEQGSVVCPFMEVSDIGLEKLTAACSFTCSDIVYDVGCGHGRMLDAVLSRYPCRGVGVEVSPNLARVAKRRLERFGDRVQIISKDVRHVDMSEATAVVMFFPPHAFNFVKAYFEQHLRPGCTLLNCTYPVPGWISSFPVTGGWHRYEIGRHLPSIP